MNASSLILRPYAASDEEATIELWRRSWQFAYPAIDFTARLTWWRERWRNELVPQVKIMIAESKNGLQGFVTIDPKNGYLDQIVVAPEAWGGDVAVRLLDAAKKISPTRIELLVNKDNARAIAFYRKHGFADAGDDVNPVSGRPVNRMRWQP